MVEQLSSPPVCINAHQAPSENESILKRIQALVIRFCLSQSWENSPERGRTTVSLYPSLKLINSADSDQMPHSVVSDLDLYSLLMSQSSFYR